jgi:hypothetical protein
LLHCPSAACSRCPLGDQQPSTKCATQLFEAIARARHGVPEKGTASVPYLRSAQPQPPTCCGVNVLLLSAARLFATRFLAASEISDYQLATATIRDPTLTGTVRGRDTKAECGCRGALLRLGCAMALRTWVGCPICAGQKRTQARCCTDKARTQELTAELCLPVSRRRLSDALVRPCRIAGRRQMPWPRVCMQVCPQRWY